MTRRERLLAYMRWRARKDVAVSLLGVLWLAALLIFVGWVCAELLEIAALQLSRWGR